MTLVVDQEPASKLAVPSHIKRTLIAGMSGNVMEWYDFALFGYFANVISKRFFPGEDPRNALLSTFAIFAVGFLMRPVGAAIFGHFGDRVGRRATLTASVLLMLIPTGLMGLLPTYAQVGLAAPVLLTILRLLQGLSIGGEYTSSITFLVEHAEGSRRGFIGSWASFSACVGILLGSAVGALLSQIAGDEVIDTWAWRLPFLLGTVVGGISLYLRTGVTETPRFKALQAADNVARYPLAETFRHHWRQLLTVVGLICVQAVAFYTIFVYLTTYLTEYAKMSTRDALMINTISMLLLCTLTPVMGYLSDRYGRRTPQLLGATGYLALSYPLFTLLARGDVMSCLLAQCVFAVFQAALTGPLPTMMVEIFPTRSRCSSLSLGYNLAYAIFGGSAPLLATLLIDRTGSILSPSLYLTLCAAVTLGVVWSMRETFREPLR